LFSTYVFTSGQDRRGGLYTPGKTARDVKNLTVFIPGMDLEGSLPLNLVRNSTTETDISYLLLDLAVPCS
jgi:hypothetical protein